MDWSPLQLEAIDKVTAWLNDPDAKQVFRLFGWAGTGKSTLAMHLAKLAGGNVAYAAFTGKAALVMRKRGCVGASTIHSLIYLPFEDPKTHEIKWGINPSSPLNDVSLLIIDEVSMVNTDLAMDLLSFGTKVLVLGDPGQLPPIEGAGYFTQAEPDAMLTEIHRQAEGNFIIRLSNSIRTGKTNLSEIPAGQYQSVTVANSRSLDGMMKADQVLCGTHKTRTAVNNMIRMERGLPHQRVVAGDKLVCLKNNRDKGLLNGQMWIVDKVLIPETTRQKEDAASGQIRLALHNEDNPMQKVLVTTHQLFFESREGEFMATPEGRRKRMSYDEFTFGYAITVHKAQGSQWDNVYLIDESGIWSRSSQADVIKHLYTGITRAAETLTVVRTR